jgi:hypothetical protein
MADHNTLEGKLEVLSKKVDNQARFTRGVILLCTSAILAANFYTITELLAILPASIMSVTENYCKAIRSASARPSVTSSSVTKSSK